MKSRERARRRRVRWGGVVVWWAVLTVVSSGALIATLIWISSLPMPQKWAPGAVSLVQPGISPRTHEENVDLVVAPISPWRSRGTLSYLILFQYNLSPAEPKQPALADPLAWLTNAEVRARAPHIQGPVRRLREVLGAVRRANGPNTHVTAIDVVIGVPIGMKLEMRAPYTIPREVRLAYPIHFTLVSGKEFVLVRLWNVLALAGTVSAVMVGVGAPLAAWARSAARRKRGQCEACGYSVVGIADESPCPECGATGRRPTRVMHGGNTASRN